MMRRIVLSNFVVSMLLGMAWASRWMLGYLLGHPGFHAWVKWRPVWPIALLEAMLVVSFCYRYSWDWAKPRRLAALVGVLIWAAVLQHHVLLIVYVSLSHLAYAVLPDEAE